MRIFNNANLRSAMDKAKEWFELHETEIQLGVTCLSAGLLIGMIKGMKIESEIFSDAVKGLTFRYPSGEVELEDFWNHITDDDFDILQRLVHEAE